MATMFDDWREQAGVGEEWTDEDIIYYNAQQSGGSLEEWAQHFGYDQDFANEGNFGKTWESAKSGYAESWNQLGNALGLDREDAIRERRAEQQLLDAANTGIRSYKDVEGVGDALEYAANTAIGSAPYLAEFAASSVFPPLAYGKAVKGLSDGARILSRAEKARIGMGSAFAGALPSSTGEILKNQYDQSGEYDLGYAIPAGAAYSAVNLLAGPERIFNRLQAGGGLGRGLTNSRAANAAIIGTTQGAGEAFEEVLQEGLSQYGRQSVDPSYDPYSPEAMDAYAESAVGGFTLGLIPGAAQGGFQNRPVDILRKEDAARELERRMAVQDEVDRIRGIGQNQQDRREAMVGDPATQEYLAAERERRLAQQAQDAALEQEVGALRGMGLRAEQRAIEQEAARLDELEAQREARAQQLANQNSAINNIVPPDPMETATVEPNQQNYQPVSYVDKIRKQQEMESNVAAAEARNKKEQDDLIEKSFPGSLTAGLASNEKITSANINAAVVRAEAKLGKEIDFDRKLKDGTVTDWLKEFIVGKTGEQLNDVKRAAAKDRKAILNELMDMYEQAKPPVDETPNAAPEATSEFKFTPAQQGIYEILANNPELTDAQIAEQTGSTQQNISKLIKQMRARAEKYAADNNVPMSEVAPAFVEVAPDEQTIGINDYVDQQQDEEVDSTDESSLTSTDLNTGGMTVRKSANDSRTVESSDDTKAAKESQAFIDANDPTTAKAQKTAEKVWKKASKVLKSVVPYSSLPPEAKADFTKRVQAAGKDAESSKWAQDNAADVVRLNKKRLNQMDEARKKARKENKAAPTWDTLDGNQEEAVVDTTKRDANMSKAKRIWDATRQKNQRLPTWEELDDAQQDRFVRAFVDNNGQRPNAVRAAEAINSKDPAKVAELIAGFVSGRRESPYFSTVDTEGKTTVEALRDALSSIVGRRFDERVVIYATEEEARAANPDLEERKNIQGWVEDLEGGDFVVKLIAGNIREGNELSVFLHEVGAHVGMENFLSADQYNELTDQIYSWARNDDGLAGDIARAAIARVQNANTPQKDTNAEVIAYFIEEAVVGGINPQAKIGPNTDLGRFIAKIKRLIKAALAKLDIVDFDSLTPQNIVDLAMGLANVSLNFNGDVSVDKRFSIYQEPTGKAKEYADSFLEKAKGAMEKVGPAVMSLHAIVKAYADKLPTLREYYNNVSEMENMQVQLQIAGHKVASKWRGLEESTRRSLSTVMMKATMLNFHVDKNFNDPANSHLKKFTPEMREAQRLYNELSPEAKEVYQEARDKLMADWHLRGQLYKDIIARTYDDLIAKADAAEEKARLEKERDAYIKEHSDQISKIKVYFPLRRFGAYIIMAKSKALKDVETKLQAEGLSAADRKILTRKLETLKKSPEHYAVAAREKEAHAKTYARSLEGFDDVSIVLADQADPKQKDITKKGVEKIKDYLTANVSPSERQKIEQMLAEMYVAQMPENNALASELKRQGVAGADKDMLRAFATTIEKNAFYMSRFKYRDTLTENMIAMKEDARKHDSDLSTKYEKIYQEVKARHALDLEYHDTPFWNGVAQASGMFHLVSPSYWMVNATQPWFIGAPVMAARFGMGKTLGEMRSSFSDAAKLVKATIKPIDTKDASKSGWKPFNDLDTSNIKDKNERAMVDQLINRGRIDINVTHDLGVMARGGSDQLSRLSTLSMWPAHQTEVINRLTVAMATYRLARKKGMTHEKAVELTDEMVIDTQIDYSNVNAARPMKNGAFLGGFGKLVFQFRKYQHAMVQLLVQNALDAYKGDKLARRTLAYMFGAQFLTAGAVGLPMANVAGLVFNALLDDDDEDGDARTQMYNALADNVGKPMADLIVKGVPSVVGMDLTKRTGMGDLFSPLPFLRTNGYTGKDVLSEVMFASAGAWTSMPAGAIDMAKFLGDGQYARAVEAPMPKGIKDIFKAYRYGTEGIKGRNKQDGVDAADISAWDVLQRGLGLTPFEEAEYYEAKTALYKTNDAIETRRSRLLRDISIARIDGDRTTELEIRNAIREFNKDHPKYRIKGSAISKSTKNRRNARRERVNEYNLGNPSEKLPQLLRYLD
jgi:DNA-binding MarR family transcriptional regulator